MKEGDRNDLNVWMNCMIGGKKCAYISKMKVRRKEGWMDECWNGNENGIHLGIFKEMYDRCKLLM